MAENKGIRLSTKTGGSIWILADEQQLRQILINLINNSIKALPEGGKIRIEVEMRTRSGSSEVPRKRSCFRSPTTGQACPRKNCAV